MHLDREGIESLLKSYDREAKALKDDLLRICWAMRGSVSINEAYMLTLEDREIISKIIQGNIEVSQKIGYPVF